MKTRVIEVVVSVGLALIGLFAFLFMCRIQEDLVLQCVTAREAFCSGHYMYPILGMGTFLLLSAPMIAIIVREEKEAPNS